jgi:hypothetical protein
MCSVFFIHSMVPYRDGKANHMADAAPQGAERDGRWRQGVGRTRRNLHKPISSQTLGHLTVFLFAGLGCATTASGPKPMGGAQHGAGAPALAQRYLADPNTLAVFKEGIRSGIVVMGMCPLQAFAVAGLPGPYMVRRDRSKWSGDIPPPEIIEAQCEAPDESVLELMFHNKTQFASPEPKRLRRTPSPTSVRWKFWV